MLSFKLPNKSWGKSKSVRTKSHFAFLNTLLLRRFTQIFPRECTVHNVLISLVNVLFSPSIFSMALVGKCKLALTRILAILSLRWEMKDKTSLLRNHISLGVLQGKKRCRRISGAFKRAVSIQAEMSDGVHTCHGLLQGIEALRNSASSQHEQKRQRGVKKDRRKKCPASSKLVGRFAGKSKVSERCARRFTNHEMYNYFLSIRTRRRFQQTFCCRLYFLLGLKTDITSHACDYFRA